MIWDCFLYNGEKDMLRIRHNEFKHLEPLKHLMPVKHIVVEADHTFSGKDKPLRFLYSDEFPSNDFIWYPILDPPFLDPWKNEERQRNAIKKALIEYGVKDDDIVIIADCDEIPRAYAIQHYRPEFGLMALQMDIYYFFLNTMNQRQVWNIAKIMTWKYLKDKTPQEVRAGGFNYCLYNAGWHYSYVGSLDYILDKFKSFSHQEEAIQQFADKDLLRLKIQNLQSIWGDETLMIMPNTEMPWYVQQNKEKFKHMIYGDVH